MADGSSETSNRDLIYADKFDARLRAELKKLVTPELVEEHRQKPLGQHSDALERVLNYFRKAPLGDKLALFEVEAGRKFQVIVNPGPSGGPPRPIDSVVYTDKDSALHAVFLERVQRLTDS